MADTIVTLGDFEFRRLEIPEAIPFGGEQALVVHQLVGGKRVVDAMGEAPEPLSWSGRFQGEGALDRARYLDGLRKAGKPLLLTWSELSFLVVIRRFVANFERSYQLPYQITCEVVEDRAAPVTELATTSLDDQMLEDQDAANGLGDEIGDSQLSKLLTSLDTAVRKVSDFATATQATINSVLEPIAAVQARVNVLVSSVGNTLSSVTTLGGVLPNNPIAETVSGFSSQLVAAQQAPLLYNLGSVLDRMSTNLAADGVAGSLVTQAGGSLYRIASETYGDPSGWTTIAKANGLLDPVLDGLNTVRVPPTMNDTGGVLDA